MIFHRVMHWRVKHRLDLLATYEPHLHYALAESSVSRKAHNDSGLSISQFRQFHLFYYSLLP